MDHVWPWWFFAELMRWKVGWKRGWIEWVKWVGLMMSWRVWKEVTRFYWIRLKIGFWEYENRQFIVRKIINILYHYGYFLKKLNTIREKKCSRKKFVSIIIHFSKVPLVILAFDLWLILRETGRAAMKLGEKLIKLVIDRVLSWFFFIHISRFFNYHSISYYSK